MEPEGSLPHLQVPATCLYPEPAQSSPSLNTDFISVPMDMARCLHYSVDKHDLEIAIMVCDMERFKLTSVEVLFLLMHWSFF
jgi:hypothetical protein